MRLLLPFAMRKLTERMMKKAQQQGQYNYGGAGNPFGSNNPFGDTNQQQSYKKQGSKDGKVTVDYVPTQEPKRKGTATAGEFIDFEEVK